MSELILNQDNIQFDRSPADVIPPVDRNDISVDTDYLMDFLINDLQDCIRYKNDYGWKSDREYELKSYYMQKEQAWANIPWKGASSYRSPLTATLVDTACAYMHESMFPENGNVLQVKGRGNQFSRPAAILEPFLNDIIENETNMKMAYKENHFRTFLSGTGIIKCMQQASGKIKFRSIDIEDIYAAINCRDFTIDECEWVHHVISLTKNELDLRRNTGVYSFEDGDIAPGANISDGSSRDQLTRQMDAISGTNLQDYLQKSNYYIVESWGTYYDKNSLRPKEIKVWWAPNGKRYLRGRENTNKIRPFARHVVYPYGDRWPGMGLPKKIRPIQNKLDYSDKQVTDWNDIAARPSMFVETTGAFDMGTRQRVPGGIYPIGVGNKIQFETPAGTVSGFDTERFNLWAQAEKLTGLIDVIQGASTKSGRTLGETQMRGNAAGIRFKDVFREYEGGFVQAANTLYKYVDLYTPKSKKIKLVGYEDYKTIGELFGSNADNSQGEMGLGIEEEFNFGFSGHPVSEREKEEEMFNDYYASAMANPVINSNPSNLYRLDEEKARRNGIRNHSTLIERPKSIFILSPQDFIQRVMSGQKNIFLRPGVDSENYILEINLFIQTDMFWGMSRDQKLTIISALKQAEKIAETERQALLDFNQMRQMGMQSSMSQNINPQMQMNSGQVA